MPGDGEPELRRRDEALRGVDTRDGAVDGPYTRHGALLDDVDPAGVRRTRVAPSHGVVADRAPARLQEAAQDREARFRRAIEVGNPSRDVVARQELRVDAVEPHRVAATHRRIDVGRRVDEIQHAARAVHHVEVEVLRELLPQLERELVEVRIGVEVVVRTHDRGIAPGVAAAEPALLEHRDLGEAMLLREVVRGREPVSAAADDDRVVARFRRWTAPRQRPALVVGPRVARQREDRVFQRGLCRPRRRYGCRRRTRSLILMAPRHARGRRRTLTVIGVRARRCVAKPATRNADGLFRIPEEAWRRRRAPRASSGDDGGGVEAARAEAPGRQDQEPVPARQEGTASFPRDGAARPRRRSRRVGRGARRRRCRLRIRRAPPEALGLEAGVREPPRARQRLGARGGVRPRPQVVGGRGRACASARQHGDDGPPARRSRTLSRGDRSRAEGDRRAGRGAALTRFRREAMKRHRSRRPTPAHTDSRPCWRRKRHRRR